VISNRWSESTQKLQSFHYYKETSSKILPKGESLNPGYLDRNSTKTLKRNLSCIAVHEEVVRKAISYKFQSETIAWKATHKKLRQIFCFPQLWTSKNSCEIMERQKSTRDTCETKIYPRDVHFKNRSLYVEIPIGNCGFPKRNLNVKMKLNFLNSKRWWRPHAHPNLLLIRRACGLHFWKSKVELHFYVWVFFVGKRR